MRGQSVRLTVKDILFCVLLFFFKKKFIYLCVKGVKNFDRLIKQLGRVAGILGVTWLAPRNSRWVTCWVTTPYDVVRLGRVSFWGPLITYVSPPPSTVEMRRPGLCNHRNLSLLINRPTLHFTFLPFLLLFYFSLPPHLQSKEIGEEIPLLLTNTPPPLLSKIHEKWSNVNFPNHITYSTLSFYILYCQTTIIQLVYSIK